MRFVLSLSVLPLAACVAEHAVPLSQVPQGFTQSECRYRESGDQHDRVQNIAYGGPPPDIVCSHKSAVVEQSAEERAWQQRIEAQLDDPDVNSYVDDLCARAPKMTPAERTQEAQKLHDVYHLTAICLADSVGAGP